MKRILGVLSAILCGIGCGSGDSEENAVVSSDEPVILDPTFVMTTDVDDKNDFGRAMAVQPDGKILVAGTAKYSSLFVPTARDRFAVVRYNKNGSLDKSFDEDGMVTTSLGSGNDGAYAMAVQPKDGRILVVGEAHNGSNWDFAMARYNSDGSLDTTFDADGKVILDLGSNERARAVALQADGKIVVAGYGSNGSDDDFILARYAGNGSLDLTFRGGFVGTPLLSLHDRASAMAIQPDGKILVAGFGQTTILGSLTDVIVLARYEADGDLDPDFHDGFGYVVSRIGTSHSRANAVAIQGDGMIVVAGYAFSGTNREMAILRYQANGTLDSTFASAGVAITPLLSEYDEASSLALQTDGKIVIAGSSGIGAYGVTGSDIAVARYYADGSLDTSFDGDGIRVQSIGPFDNAAAVALQSNGQILLAGTAFTGSSYDFALLRLP